MPHAPRALMLFAAGFGTRMGKLTQHRPKPLIEVAGRPLIDHALALTEEQPIDRIVANVHYLPDQIRQHLAGRALISDESAEILETGGGLRAALPLLGAGPVFTLNSDAVWTGQNPLAQLAQAWAPDAMDALLLLLPADQARGYRGRGDFLLQNDGRITRAAGAEGLAYLGAQIIKTTTLQDIPERSFSLNLVWDRAIAQGRAYGILHRGGWCDVGRPEGIAEAEALLAHV